MRLKILEVGFKTICSFCLVWGISAPLAAWASQALDSAATTSLSTEDKLEGNYKEVIFPFVESKITEKTFLSERGYHLTYAYMPKLAESNGLVILLEGRTEFYKKYYEVIYDVYRRGFDVAIMDWASQGRSHRFEGVNPEHTHIDDLAVHVTDLHTFLNEPSIVSLRSGGKMFGLAHSMGGAIVSLFAAENEGVFDKIAFFAPMMELATSPLPEWVLLQVLKLAETIGYSKSGFPFVEPFSEDEENNVTHSLIRRKVFFEQRVKYRKEVTAGFTVGYARSALGGTRKVRDVADQIKIPILLFQATKDVVVLPNGQKKFCETALNCRFELAKGAMHEILMEVDSIRNPALEKALKFFHQDGE